MIKLSKKYSDDNHNIFSYSMISQKCEYGNNEGYLISPEVINVKHCHNKRSEYDLNWWDHKFSNCVGQDFNINTKKKLNISKKLNCNPTDFSKANEINCKSHILINNDQNNKLENYCPNTFNDFNYGNIKTCDIFNNNIINYNNININCVGSDIYCK